MNFFLFTSVIAHNITVCTVIQLPCAVERNIYLTRSYWLTDFCFQTSNKIFGGDVKCFNLLFISKQVKDFLKINDAFKEAAKQFKGKVSVIAKSRR